jgi:hypothetical protein
MTNIVLIGVGNFGKYHLMSMANFNEACTLHIVDTSHENLQRASSLIQNWPSVPGRNIELYDAIEKLNTHYLDVVIIATTAQVRHEIVVKLFNQFKIQNMILEKVAFPSIPQFENAVELCTKNNTKCWINCPRRLNPFYQNLAVELSSSQTITMTAQGGNWGMASNTVHLLDYFFKLCHPSWITAQVASLEQKLYPSKRDRCWEIGGTLVFSTDKGQLIIHDHKSSQTPFLLTIGNEQKQFIISEATENAFVFTKTNRWEWKTIEFKNINQSEQTHTVVEQILKDGTCPLTPLTESLEIHRPMLQAFNQHFTNLTGQTVEICPIT